MTDGEESWQILGRELRRTPDLSEKDPVERGLKESLDLDFYFRNCLFSVIAKSNEDVKLIRAYRLARLNESTREELKARVRAALTSPQEIGSYQLAIASNKDEADALRLAEIDGLILLGMLGDKETIPTLLARLKEIETSNSRMRIVVGATLRYLTGQDIGGYILSNRDISLWEEWWEQNKPSTDNE
jgi:hypothetical protein